MKLYISVNKASLNSAFSTCKSFRSDTETCSTGCPKEQVKKGNTCPFDVDTEGDNPQTQCACYKN